jgi:hypothetical protein
MIDSDEIREAKKAGDVSVSIQVTAKSTGRTVYQIASTRCGCFLISVRWPARELQTTSEWYHRITYRNPQDQGPFEIKYIDFD